MTTYIKRRLIHSRAELVLTNVLTIEINQRALSARVKSFLAFNLKSCLFARVGTIGLPSFAAKRILDRAQSVVQLQSDTIEAHLTISGYDLYGTWIRIRLTAS